MGTHSPGAPAETRLSLCTLLLHSSTQVYDAAEIFAGRAVVAGCLIERGLTTVAMDIDFWQPYAEQRASAGLPVSINNPLDILQPAGFAPLGLSIIWVLPQLCNVDNIMEYSYRSCNMIPKIDCYRVGAVSNVHSGCL